MHQCTNTTYILLVLALSQQITVVLCSPPPVGYLVTLNGFVAPPDAVTVISRYGSRTLTISRITPRVALFILQLQLVVAGPGRSVAAAARTRSPTDRAGRKLIRNATKRNADCRTPNPMILWLIYFMVSRVSFMTCVILFKQLYGDKIIYIVY